MRALSIMEIKMDKGLTTTIMEIFMRDSGLKENKMEKESTSIRQVAGMKEIL